MIFAEHNIIYKELNDYFFNNWNAIVYSLPLGFLIALYNMKKNNG